MAVLVSAAVGGLAAPVLFFAPTLALVAVGLGLRLGPLRWRTVTLGGAALLLGLAVGSIPLGARLISETSRSQATLARDEGRLAEAVREARAAIDRDGRNPRAWMERGLLCERLGDPSCARRSFREAARDLPSDAVVSRATGSDLP